MKKSKLLILGLIALMLVGGLVLASCDEKCEYNCGKKTSDCGSFIVGCNGDNTLKIKANCETACGLGDAIDSITK